MQRKMMKSKIHRATVTGTDLNYRGSITIDQDLMDVADLMEYEQVHVLDISNGQRFETYVIAGARGSREISVNGAAARLAQPGDRVIVVAYADYSEDELADYRPAVIQVDDRNEPVADEIDLAFPSGPR